MRPVALSLQLPWRVAVRKTPFHKTRPSGRSLRLRFLPKSSSILSQTQLVVSCYDVCGGRLQSPRRWKPPQAVGTVGLHTRPAVSDQGDLASTRLTLVHVNYPRSQIARIDAECSQLASELAAIAAARAAEKAAVAARFSSRVAVAAAAEEPQPPSRVISHR